MSEPTTTKALLVGIEKYKAGDNWNLNGPAHDVIRMAQRLTKQNVPPENLTIFLSPLDNNQETIEKARELTGSEPAPATKSSIQDELSRPQRESASLPPSHRGGHGWVTLEGERRLFYADARKDDERNLDFNDLLVSACSDSYRKMPRQLFIADTCANYIPQIRNPPSDQLGKKEPRFFPEQFVLFAGKLGDRAKNLDSEGTGLYTRELLAEFDRLSPNESWPPDMEAISARLQRKFIDLRNQKLTEQTPTYLWNRDWSGNERNFGQMPFTPILNPTNPLSLPANLPRRLSILELSKVRDSFLRCPSIIDRQKRDKIVEMLRPEIFMNIRRGDDVNIDILNIFQSVRNYQGGLKELLEIINYFEVNSIQFQVLDRDITLTLLEEIQ